MDLDAFIQAWRTNTKGNERANKDSFIRDLCAVLGVPPPPQKTGDRDRDAYVFEADILSTKEGGQTTVLKADLYKQGCFLLEAKQGSDVKGAGIPRATPAWNLMMDAAFGQALSYVGSINDPPPFIITCDIGYAFDLYADFDGSGRYLGFPDPQNKRHYVTALAQHLDTLRAIFTDPRSLDPSLAKIKVTRTVAEHIAQVARYLEKAKHPPEAIAKFLMRCLFTMFAEDVDLLPNGLFTTAIENVWLPKPETFKRGIENLWAAMNTGGFFGAGDAILRFNGGLFVDPFALPLGPDGLRLLLDAAKCDWSDVEPAIFGTLLERALSEKERHALGAHFTPRAYVERLVRPTVEEPVRFEWENVRAAASKLQMDGNIEGAKKAVHAFHQKLCQTQVLDPACGTGNFLYVTLNIFKQLESEVLALLANLGEKQELLVRVSPKQFLGIEVKPWAKEIAELVLWLGYLQWHYRTHGKGVLPPEPVLQDFKNIKCRDAVLAWDTKELRRDERGKAVTRWDRVTYKRNPITRKEVPDETAQVAIEDYVNPRPREWPPAHYIVGNPPFVANRNMPELLGLEYVAALRAAYPEIKDAVDFVMLFWHKAALAVANGAVRRAGLITTSRIRLQQNQGVVRRALADGIRLLFAIPDHPWPGDPENAEVRISMTVLAPADTPGTPKLVLTPVHDKIARGKYLTTEVREQDLIPVATTNISADLSPSVDISVVSNLASNSNLNSAGVKPYSESLIVTEVDAKRLLPNVKQRKRYAREYRNGQDIGQWPRGVRAIDLFGMTEVQVQEELPELYQYLLDSAKPERAEERNPRLKANWWLFEANRKEMRRAISGVSRYIVTVENSPVRAFVFLDSSILPDQKLRVIASDDAFVLGVLSSGPHCLFALRLGGRHGVRNTPVYNTRCFVTFPFPETTDAQRQRIRTLGEQLDQHRKSRQMLHPGMALTDMYNVLEKLRTGAELTDKDRDIHERGLVSILRKIHDDLDSAVFAAYGWPAGLTDEEILTKLVALNAERAEEEKKGTIRWLRPDYQNPTGRKATTQAELLPIEEAEEEAPPPSQVKPWPKKLADQVVAVRALVAEPGKVFSLANVAAGFKGAKKRDVEGILDSIAGLGLLTVFQTVAGKRWRAVGKAPD